MDRYKARFSFLNHITKRWFWGKRVYNAYKADEVANLAKLVLKYINCDVEEWTWGFHKQVEEKLMQIVKEGEDG